MGVKTGSIVFSTSFAAMLQNKLYIFVACFIVPEAVQDYSSNISNKKRSVSSPDETPRRELKIRRAVEYF